MKRTITLKVNNGEEVTVVAYREGDAIIVERNGDRHEVRIVAAVRGDSRDASIPAAAEQGATDTASQHAAAKPVSPRRPTSAPLTTPPSSAAPTVAEGATAVTAPMTGVVKEVLVSSGDTVADGQRVVVMEAMKMDVYVNAPKAGVIASVDVKPSEAVEGGRVLLTIEEA
jgi:biotin carboxyl carrier protein